MSKIIVTIQRSNIYHIAEGISVSISQHNGGTPTYEQLWASPDEAKKLDIYYREAISDLERHLTQWILVTSAQFNLTQDGTDYKLALMMSPHWPERMHGLLVNKIQDYLVHAVTAGWLNDFAGLEIKQDYRAMAAQDLSDIREVICKRDFAFKEQYRNRDNDIVDTRSDYTDWSGTGIAYRQQRPACPPPVCGQLNPRGVSIHHQPERPCPPPPCPPPQHHHKDPRIPDNPTHPNYPPIHANGIGWSDDPLYDYPAEEHYINDDD